MFPDQNLDPEKVEQGSNSPLQQPTLAEQADKHLIYEQAVQSPEADVELIQRFYKQCRGRKAKRLREDFCGTGLTLSHWVRQGSRYSGEGYDIDAETVEWGRAQNFVANDIPPERGALYIADAREKSTEAPDVRCAFNFSYWVFRERQEMVRYFKLARKDLAKNGVLMLDITGGTQSTLEDPFETELDDFSLIWQQKNYSPIDHSADLTLTFRFEDGSQIEPPYRYHWRVWSIPEVLEMLEEAGFAETRIWLQDDDHKSGYYRTEKIDNDTCWVACLVALK